MYYLNFKIELFPILVCLLSLSHYLFVGTVNNNYAPDYRYVFVYNTDL